jgi:hypothetical protein
MGIRTRTAIAVAGGALALTAPADAAVTGVANNAAGAGTLAATLPVPGTAVGQAAFGVQHGAQISPGAISDGPLAAFPTHGQTFGILSTGDATAADNPNTNVPDDTGIEIDDQSVDLGTSQPARGPGVYDTSILVVPFTATATANCVSIDFQFLTEEWQEYASGQFNDAFFAELDGNTWSVAHTAPNPPVFTAPLNFAFGPGGEEISVNAGGELSMSIANAAGTTYDGATPLLSAATPITPGQHTLYLSIFDHYDGIVDSAVFVDRLAVGFVPNPEVNCVPGAEVRELDLTLDPVEGTAATGSQHTVRAKLSALGGGPIPSADIDFQVVGAQAASGTRKTGADGVAEFSYPGIIAGEDAISACYDADNDGTCEVTASSKATWTSPPEGPPQDPPARGPVCAGLEGSQLGDDAKNKIKGTKKADGILGYGGNDKISGKKGNDRICGGPGKDKLKGGPGNDVLKGNDGNDVLIGGPGQDKCVGGRGKERLRQC